MSEAFGITFISTPVKRECKFLELCNPVSRADRDSCRNFFRHFCRNRTADQAITAALEHCSHYPHMLHYVDKLKTALS